ncbi:MAG: hypothetical protein ACTTHG_00835 [Treponemataceae bacterium]
MEKNFQLDMNIQEVKELCLFFRSLSFEKTKFITDLETELENYLFNTMTIDEAERFFNEQ